MNISPILDSLIAGENLSEETAGEAISAIMSGEIGPASISAMLTAFRCKGETEEEIAGAAKAMVSYAEKIRFSSKGVTDTCGTGGDRSGTFNISTTSAFVVAGAGVPVAKHGNRSATSHCGSIDLLEKLGVNVMIQPERIGQCLDEVGLTILFARVVHPAMRYAAPIRSELGFRTIFNYLGPLTNPARPSYQLVGVSDPNILDIYAACLQRMGVQRAWAAFASDGLDEITLSGPTAIVEATPQSIQRKEIVPEDAGLKSAPAQSLRGGTPEENEKITRRILSGEEKGPCRDAVLLNAGAALVVSGKAASLKDGAALAAESIDSGRAAKVLEKLVRFTNA
ncbi:MAG: anthranilate phosphoribosyltransferase [Candidatus Omnitrophota bacterium]